MSYSLTQKVTKLQYNMSYDSEIGLNIKFGLYTFKLKIVSMFAAERRRHVCVFLKVKTYA